MVIELNRTWDFKSPHGGAGCEFSQGEDSPTRENPVKLDLKPDLVAER